MTLITPTSNDNRLVMVQKGRIATHPNDQLAHKMVQVRPPNGASQPAGDGLVHYCISLLEEGRRFNSLQREIGFGSSTPHQDPMPLEAFV